MARRRPFKVEFKLVQTTVNRLRANAPALLGELRARLEDFAFYPDNYIESFDEVLPFLVQKRWVITLRGSESQLGADFIITEDGVVWVVEITDNYGQTISEHWLPIA